MKKYVVRWQNRFTSGEIVARDDYITARSKKDAEARITACYGKWREFAIISVKLPQSISTRGRGGVPKLSHVVVCETCKTKSNPQTTKGARAWRQRHKQKCEQAVFNYA